MRDRRRFSVGNRVIWTLVLIFGGMQEVVMGQESGSSNSARLEPRARTGDASAQRELAECYRRGCADISANPVLACAWGIVLVASGHPQVTPADSDHRRRDCESLTPAQQSAAAAQARVLFQNIYRRELLLPADFFGGNKRQ